MAEQKVEAPVQAGRRVGMPWVTVVLSLAVVASAVGVIYTAHRSRELFRTLEQARREQNEIQIEWRQLLLERSTLSAHARVEQIAGEQLQMAVPEVEMHATVSKE